MSANPSKPHSHSSSPLLSRSSLLSLCLLLAAGLGAGCDQGSSSSASDRCYSDESCASGTSCIGGVCRSTDDRCQPEVCDGRDNDCDGVVDNGNNSFCGACDPSCRSTGRAPFDPEAEESSSVGLDERGALVLTHHRVDTRFIWIANTGEGTISKVDTRTYEEIARYRTGPHGADNDPSRTSVNGAGDVYVGNRGRESREARSVTKISVLGSDCPDTNGDGVITTSSGPDDLLPWGQDDCVLWRRPLTGGGLIRAVAAQDEFGPDGAYFPYVWVGGYDGRVWRLDGRSGEVLVNIEGPTTNYGFALDGQGNLWISGRADSQHLGRIDTDRCRTTDSCDTRVCDEEGDDCTLQAIHVPGRRNIYGITVDPEQRIWLALYESGEAGGVARYDPTAPFGSRWTTVPIGVPMHGIAADGEGWIWAAAGAAGVIRLNADDPEQWAIVEGTGGRNAKGMAIDFDGRVWTIHRTDGSRPSSASIIEAGPTLEEASVTHDVATTIRGPYTYSDMTGQQLRLATRPRGWYRRVFTGCEEGRGFEGTAWTELAWVADLPFGTRMLFRARTATTAEALRETPWVLVAETPDADSPADLAAAFSDAGISPERYLELEVQLIAERESLTEIVSPRLYAMEATYQCVEPLF